MVPKILEKYEIEGESSLIVILSTLFRGSRRKIVICREKEQLMFTNSPF